MKKHALIVTQERSDRLSCFEKALLQLGFDTVRVPSPADALYRVQTEIFSVIICVDNLDGSFQRQLVMTLSKDPFGCITPFVVLGHHSEPQNRTALPSVLDQYFPETTDPHILSEFCDETHSLRGTKAKRGKLGKITFPQILKQAAELKVDGAIVIERQQEKCIIYLEQGYVVFASSNRDENRFGEFLVQQGIISKYDFLRATELLEKTTKRLSRILVDEGIIKPQVLQTLIQSQVKHIIYTVFDWPDGEYYILLGEKPYEPESNARFRVSSLILEGVRFKFHEDQLNRIFSPFDQKISLSTSLAQARKQFQLGQNEVDFLRLVGSGRNMGELLNLNSYTRLDSLKLLYAFHILGILSFEQTVTSKSAFESAPDNRQNVMDELFETGQKSNISRTSKERIGEITKDIPLPQLPFSVGSRTFHIILGALALTFCFWVTTLIDPRFSRDIQSMEGKVTEVKRPLPTPKEVVKVVVLAPKNTEIQPAKLPAKKVPKTKPTPKVSKASKVAVHQRKKLRESRVNKLLKKAHGYKKQEKTMLALSTYRQALKIRPNDLSIKMEVGNLLFDLERTEEARNLFEGLVSQNQRLADPYLMLGTIYLMDGEQDEAKSALRKYLRYVKKTSANRSRILEAGKILQSLESN